MLTHKLKSFCKRILRIANLAYKFIRINFLWLLVHYWWKWRYLPKKRGWRHNAVLFKLLLHVIMIVCRLSANLAKIVRKSSFEIRVKWVIDVKGYESMGKKAWFIFNEQVDGDFNVSLNSFVFKSEEINNHSSFKSHFNEIVEKHFVLENDDFFLVSKNMPQGCLLLICVLHRKKHVLFYQWIRLCSYGHFDFSCFKPLGISDMLFKSDWRNHLVLFLYIINILH